MTTEANRTDEEFVLGKHYDFDPPVATNCITVCGDHWEQKRFTGGWCLKYEPKLNSYIFQGKPVGEKNEFYFLVVWGKGCVARRVSPPRLYAVK